jgi:hypothetical protein
MFPETEQGPEETLKLTTKPELVVATNGIADTP